jgi:hypothetical protein
MNPVYGRIAQPAPADLVKRRSSHHPPAAAGSPGGPAPRKIASGNDHGTARSPSRPLHLSAYEMTATPASMSSTARTVGGQLDGRPEKAEQRADACVRHQSARDEPARRSGTVTGDQPSEQAALDRRARGGAGDEPGREAGEEQGGCLHAQWTGARWSSDPVLAASTIEPN